MLGIAGARRQPTVGIFSSYSTLIASRSHALRGNAGSTDRCRDVELCGCWSLGMDSHGGPWEPEGPSVCRLHLVPMLCVGMQAARTVTAMRSCVVVGV